MKRLLAMALVLLPLLAGGCAHARARAVAVQLKNAPDTTAGSRTERAHATGVYDGMYSAAKTPHTNTMITGVTLGFLFPIPGPLGMCLVHRHPDPTPPDQLATATKRGTDYLSGYQEGYAQQSKDKKHNEGCMGALLGASTAFAIISALMIPR